jgi:hypothetical protein
MAKLRIFCVAVAVVLVSGLVGFVPPAQAQPVHMFTLSYWPTSVRCCGGTGTWNTGFIVIDYSGVFRAPFGLRASGAFGSQSSWGGPGWAGVTDSGNDAIWSVDLFYQRSTGNTVLRFFGGYGSMEYNSNFTGAVQTETWRATGLRVGGEVAIMTAGPLAFVGSVAWYPSMSITFRDDGGGGFSSAGAGNGVDWQVLAVWRPQGGNWGISAGYRGASFSCTNATGGCFVVGEGMTWSGFIVGVTFTR